MGAVTCFMVGRFYRSDEGCFDGIAPEATNHCINKNRNNKCRNDLDYLKLIFSFKP